MEKCFLLLCFLSDVNGYEEFQPTEVFLAVCRSCCLFRCSFAPHYCHRLQRASTNPLKTAGRDKLLLLTNTVRPRCRKDRNDSWLKKTTEHMWASTLQVLKGIIHHGNKLHVTRLQLHRILEEHFVFSAVGLDEWKSLRDASNNSKALSTRPFRNSHTVQCDGVLFIQRSAQHSSDTCRLNCLTRVLESKVYQSVLYLHCIWLQ